MHAVIRSYVGPNAAQFVDAMEERRTDIEGMIAAIDGFVSYTLVRTHEGGVSVSVYQTKEGADASSRRIAEFVDAALAAQDRVTPSVSEGAVVLHLDAH